MNYSEPVTVRVRTMDLEHGKSETTVDYDRISDFMIEMMKYRADVARFDVEAQETETEFSEKQGRLMITTTTLGGGNSMDLREAYEVVAQNGEVMPMSWNAVDDGFISEYLSKGPISVKESTRDESTGMTKVELKKYETIRDFCQAMSDVQKSVSAEPNGRLESNTFHDGGSELRAEVIDVHGNVAKSQVFTVVPRDDIKINLTWGDVDTYDRLVKERGENLSIVKKKDRRLPEIPEGTDCPQDESQLE